MSVISTSLFLLIDAVKSTKSEFLFAIYANRTKIVREYFKRDESLVCTIIITFEIA